MTLLSPDRPRTYTEAAVHIGVADLKTFAAFAKGVGGDVFGDYTVDGGSWSDWKLHADAEDVQHVVVNTNNPDGMLDLLERVNGPIFTLVDHPAGVRAIVTLADDWTVELDRR